MTVTAKRPKLVNRSTHALPLREPMLRQPIALAESIPRMKRSQIRVGDESKEIPEFSDAQETVSITVGRLELRLDEAQQLTPTHLALVIHAGALISLFGHASPPPADCPRQDIKML
jgi:hypothetical protein